MVTKYHTGIVSSPGEINVDGTRLCLISSGKGARIIENLITRDIKQCEGLFDQVCSKSEIIALVKQRYGDILKSIKQKLKMAYEKITPFWEESMVQNILLTSLHWIWPSRI